MGDGRFAWFGLGVMAAWLLCALAAPVYAQDSGVMAAAGDIANTGADSSFDNSPNDDSAEAKSDADGSDAGGSDGRRPRSKLPGGLKPAVQDGDLSVEMEPQAPVDGVIDMREPQPVEDGIDPIGVDARDAEDIAAFENPPAGYDPLLFQIEDLDPITDNRRVARLFRAEPYDPVGIRIGSFVLFPELEFGGSWYPNVFRAPNASADAAFDLKPSARFVSNWARHALEFRATGGLSWFSDYDTENDRSYLLEGRGRLDVTRRTNVQALLSHEAAPESRSALDASSVGTRSTQTVDRAEASFNHRFNRLSVQLRGAVADYSYGATEYLGATTENRDRDYRRTEETVRASWEFKPTFSVFGEVGVNQRDYDTVATSDGIKRSSDGQRYRAGISFGNTGEIWRGEIGLGYGVQTPDDRRLHEISGLLIDANATWRATELTSLLFTAQTDISETTTTNVGGAFYRSLGVEVRHQLRRYLIASAGLTYSTQNSEDGVIDESEMRTTLGLEYYLSREAVLFGRYAHSSFNAVGTASDYSSDEIHFGMRLRR